MMSINQAFVSASVRSGEALEFEAEGWPDFVPATPSLYQDLLDAVADLRRYWRERSLSASLRAAREGVDSVVAFLLHGGRFDTSRDTEGLDAGYWLARRCVPYDFIALGTVARSGPLQDVRPVRYYNQHVDGRAVFLAACEAGLTFSACRDSDGLDAGFFIARCGDEELIARFEGAGGCFRERELKWLGRAPARKVA